MTRKTSSDYRNETEEEQEKLRLRDSKRSKRRSLFLTDDDEDEEEQYQNGYTEDDSDENEDDLGNDNGKKIIRIVLIIVGILTIAIIGFAIYSMLHGSGSSASASSAATADIANMPSLAGQSESDAEALAKKYDNMTVEKTEEYSTDYAEGSIISQEVTTDNGKNVLHIVVSKGADPDEEITLPDFTGQFDTQVKAFFSQNKMNNVTYVYTADSSLSEGQYVSCSVHTEKVARSAAFTVTFAKPADKTSQITLTDFTGKTLDEAEKYAKANGLTIKKTFQRSETIAENVVISQNPTAGSKVVYGGTVALAVSTGKTTAMQDLTDTTKEASLDFLAQYGFKTAVVELYSDTITAGNVIRTAPSAGNNVKDNAVVTLYVSLGKPYIEDLRNQPKQSLDSAIADINKKGGNITITYTYTDSSDVPIGEIVGMNIAGSFVSTTEHLTAVISNGTTTLASNFAGWKLSDVQNWAVGKTVAMRYDYQYSDSVAKDLVISNSPASGVLSPGDTESVLVSLGKFHEEDISNNGFVGHDFDDVQKEVEDANAQGADMVVQYIEESSDSVPAGEVISQTYDGTSLILHVSTGK
jgi:beta-lactam-binding protein with PASTA domain